MRRLPCLLAAALVLSSPPAPAQDRGFSAQHFLVAPGPGSFLTQEGAFVPAGIKASAVGLLGYQYKPVVLRSCGEIEGGECTQWNAERGALLRHQLWLDLGGAISVFGIFEAGLVLPVVLYQSGDAIRDSAGDLVERRPGGHVGLGDIRLHLRLDILHGVFKVDNETFGLALVPALTFPVGHAIHADSFLGDSSVTVHPRIAFEVRLEKVRLGLNLGYMWREHKTFHMTDMGHRLTYGVAAEVPIKGELLFVAELFGASGFTPDIASSPLELDTAVRYRLDHGLSITGGLGLGLIAAVGTPWFRLFAGVAWTGPAEPKPKVDSDGDTIADNHDDCPDEPEDRDKFEDRDGCPDPDNDGDTIPDSKDSCPDDPEDEDGFEDGDGCPDDDNDGDTIPDSKDSCPDDPEDADGFDDKDGCPDGDNDGDTIPDADDACDDDPEDADGFEDKDGCPDKDNDGDGVPDADDQCPTEKEVLNDFEDSDGCPDKGKALLEMKPGQIEVLEKINFATNSDKIVGAKSFKVLKTVLSILEGNPDMKIRIEGHTDNVGEESYNLDLSKRRAESVKKWLVENGVDEKRITTEGLGPKKPIADNDTKEGRAKNRRVEFHIVD